MGAQGHNNGLMLKEMLRKSEDLFRKAEEKLVVVKPRKSDDSSDWRCIGKA